jgi:hypothetical protein
LRARHRAKQVLPNRIPTREGLWRPQVTLAVKLQSGRRIQTINHPVIKKYLRWSNWGRTFKIANRRGGKFYYIPPTISVWVARQTIGDPEIAIGIESHTDRTVDRVLATIIHNGSIRNRHANAGTGRNEGKEAVVQDGIEVVAAAGWAIKRGNKHVSVSVEGNTLWTAYHGGGRCGY